LLSFCVPAALKHFGALIHVVEKPAHLGRPDTSSENDRCGIVSELVGHGDEILNDLRRCR
jgi:hypothetical protein